jgi:surface polysaccharide O-acyltransferase-like enzyme
LVAWNRNWLLRIPYQFGMRWFWVALTWGSLIWLAAIAAIVATHTEDHIAGGLTWQSAIVCFWESFFCVGICLGLTVIFREKFNGRNRFTQWMTDNCFSVYLFHAPILIAVTLAMHRFAAPKAVKFFAAALLGTTLTYLASHWIFRRIPVLRRVL